MQALCFPEANSCSLQASPGVQTRDKKGKKGGSALTVNWQVREGMSHTGKLQCTQYLPDTFPPLPTQCYVSPGHPQHGPGPNYAIWLLKGETLKCLRVLPFKNRYLCMVPTAMGDKGKAKQPALPFPEPSLGVECYKWWLT